MAEKTFTFKIPDELNKRVEATAKATYKPKAVLVREAILAFLRDYEKTHTLPNVATA